MNEKPIAADIHSTGADLIATSHSFHSAGVILAPKRCGFEDHLTIHEVQVARQCYYAPEIMSNNPIGLKLRGHSCTLSLGVSARVGRFR